MNCRLFCFLLVWLIAGAAYAQDRGLMAREQRIALVVGNSAYQVGPLRNPANDADDMAAALQNLGFRVTKLNDASNRQMVEAINRFGQELQGRRGFVFLCRPRRAEPRAQLSHTRGRQHRRRRSA